MGELGQELDIEDMGRVGGEDDSGASGVDGKHSAKQRAAAIMAKRGKKKERDDRETIKRMETKWRTRREAAPSAFVRAIPFPPHISTFSPCYSSF